ncbi:uncharacterized protein LOC144866328 [Branchiostoma floridae x Branchiostoma japonicum]
MCFTAKILAKSLQQNYTIQYQSILQCQRLTVLQQMTPLHLAAENGHHETVSALLTAGADVNVQNSEQRTPLHLAAEKGHHETVSVLLAAGADVDVQGWKQRTPLHLAAEKGHHETVSALLAPDTDANKQCEWQSTNLHLASWYGHHELVSALLAAGADVNVRDRHQRTPLHLAAEKGHHETVSALLTAGADVNAQDKWQRTPLHPAAWNCQHETVTALLAAAADVNVQDYEESTPLHLAAEKGHHENVSALLASGAGVNVQDKWQRTPLHLAAENDVHETVSALLVASADVNLQDSGQRTPLHLAAKKGHHETVSALLTAGADVYVGDGLQRTPLHLAAENGHHETVSALLAAGADVNVPDIQQRTPLQLAAENGSSETVSALLAAGADVYVQERKQRTPLHLAATKGHHETVSALLAAGADVNAQDSRHMTPLHLAAENGHHETASALLTAGADVNAQDRQQRTSLHLAAENGHHETVSALLAAGADVKVQDSLQKTPLHLAAENGHRETFSALLTADADVDVQDTWQRTPLHLAAENGHIETVSALLTDIADVNVRDNEQRTPLHLAVQNGHHETVSALLTAGADVNVQDIRQRTPIHLAAEKGHHETVSAFLAAGADVTVQDSRQRTSLHLAAENGHHETVSALLAAGADVNVQDDVLKTPLHLAAENGHPETVSALLAAGADVNVRDNEHETPLHLAAGNGHEETVSVLLAAKAEVNIRGGQQRTALHMAVIRGHHETVSALLTAGADVSEQDSWKRTLLHLAAENGHHETVSVLLAAGADVKSWDRQHDTPLHLAAEEGHHETVSALLAAGAIVNSQDWQQRAPLHKAAYNGHHQTVFVLLETGADVNVRDSLKWTPVHDAAVNGHHETISVLLTAGADVNSHGGGEKTPLHLAAEEGHHETVSALLAAGADVNSQDWQQRTPLHLAADNGHLETVSALLTAGAEVKVWDSEKNTPLHLSAKKGHHETVSALLAGDAGVNVGDNEQRTPLHLAAENGHHETVSALLTAGADVNAKDNEGNHSLRYATEEGHSKCVEVLLQHGADEDSQKEVASGQKEVFGPELVHFYEEKGMIVADSKDPLVEEAAKQTGTTIEDVLNFIINYSQAKLKDDTGEAASKTSISIGLEQMLDTILSQLVDTDVRLLMRVWSARTGKQESPNAGAKAPTDLMTDMMKSEYITSGDLGELEKDMMAAGISFPAIARSIPDVPEELKYTRTTEAAVGPTGGELEIPGFVKLVVPPNVLQQDTIITISTVDVAAILRDPESVTWLSGYPWSLGEDACPRELLDQVLFSPAVDVNLHGAQLNGPVEVQTWRPPGSEGMKCILLKHHDEEGWTDITASTEYQIYSDKISLFLRSFSPVVTEWAPVEMVISVGKMMVDALSSRTLECRFAAYINPSLEDVQFHVVCRDHLVETDEYQTGFTKCGNNAAMFDLVNGDVLDITVSVRGGKNVAKQMVLQSKQCRAKNGQNVQMLLDRPNGNRVKGDVDVKQVPSKRTVCQFIFKEEGDFFLSHYKRGSTTEESDSTQSTSIEPVESVRHSLAATGITGRIDVLPAPAETSRPRTGPGDIRAAPIVRGSRSKSVVLLINDDYGTSHGGVSTIHRQMAAFLVSKGAKVYSTVLGATKDDEDDAAADGVQLILPATFKGDERNPSLDWLTWDHQTRYPNLPTDVDFIVGHVNITSGAARQIKEKRLPIAKLVQVTHAIPEETSHYQGDNKVMSIGEETDSILDDLRHADVIFSVGPLIYDYYTHQTKQLQLQHHEFLPKPSDIFSKMQVNYVNTKTKVVLSVGRIKGMERLKGYDLVAKSMFIVLEHLPNTKWRAFGVSPEDFPESKKAIQAHLERGQIHFTPLKNTTQEELSEEMKRAHVVLMPSRAEPFGLVGLEAIAAGVPVLVSDKSGLAWFLDKHPDLDRPIVEIEDDDDKAAETLAKCIIRVLKDGSKEFEAARKMKEHLLSSKPWEASHHKFLKTFGL